MKTSDDGGKTWTQIRQIGSGIGVGGIAYDRVTKSIVLHFPDSTGSVAQVTSVDQGKTWSVPMNVSSMLGPIFSPFSSTRGGLAVGPGAGLQLSSEHPTHPNRLLFTGHHGAYQYDCVWYSDDHGKTWTLSLNETTGAPARFEGLDEPAIAETPQGGVIIRARNEIFHGPGKCDCRGTAESNNGGSSFQGGVGFDPALPEPVCQGTMLNDWSTGKIFSAMPGFGTDVEKKDGHDGRGNGVIRWSSDGGKSWPASIKLWQGNAYSYSCLSHVPMSGYIGLAWETVLPNSGPHKRDISANNILWSIIPTNFTS